MDCILTEVQYYYKKWYLIPPPELLLKVQIFVSSANIYTDHFTSKNSIFLLRREPLEYMFSNICQAFVLQEALKPYFMCKGQTDV